jgi:DNA-binding transcriptional ArsR family regulator
MYKNPRPASPASLDGIFGALADGSRRAMLARLARGESSVSELAQPLDMTLPAVLKHLRVLESAGLVTAVKDGRVKRCQLDVAPFAAVNDWLAETYNFWNTRLDSLARHLESNQPQPSSTTQEKSRWPPPPHRRSASRSGASSARRARKSSDRGRTRRS